MKTRKNQRGVTLLLGLILLIMLTLLGVSAFNIGSSYFRIISNKQYQTEAMAAAQSAINQILSSGNYFKAPATAPSSLQIDINGDGNPDYKATIARPCLLSSIAITIGELSASNADDLKCLGSSKSPTFWWSSGPSTYSECARVTWRVTATVDDSGASGIGQTRAKVVLTEAAALRMDRAKAEAYRSNSSYRCTQ